MPSEPARLQQLAHRYQCATRSEKSAILENLQQSTGWSRDHCRRSLRQATKSPTTESRPGRPSGSRKYSTQAISALAHLWHIAGAPSGRRLEVIMPSLLRRLEDNGELHGDLAAASVRDELANMSSASIDRYLRSVRESAPAANDFATECPQQQLAARKPVPSAGFFRLCVTADSAPDNSCSHIVSLTLCDKLTGWRMRLATTDTAPRSLFRLLDHTLRVNPVPISSIRVHSGGELLDFTLISWAQQHGLDVTPQTFATMAPPPHNPECRCDTRALTLQAREAQLRTELWHAVDLRHNFLLPITRAKYKVWTESGTVRVFDNPMTPLERLHASAGGYLTDRLRHLDAKINPAAISREITRLSAELAWVREARLTAA